MAEFDITRIRYTWKGNWTTSTAYKIDDIVKYGGSSYTCIRLHTSTNFEADQDFLTNPGDTLPSPAWSKMTDGFAFRGSWAQNTVYAFGDLTLYGGLVYVCIDGHTSASTFAENNAKFSVYISLFNFRQNWTQNTRYGVGDLVRNGGIIYRCIIEHTSSNIDSGLEADQAKWAILFDGIDYKGDWTATTKYVVNDLIKYGGSVFRCIEAHISTAHLENGKFQIEFPGYEFSGEWNDSSYYAVGDLVLHGGWLYKAVTNNFNKVPGDSIYQPTSVDWEVVAKGTNFLGDWNPSGSYKTGDVVRRGGFLYEALLDTTDDGSTLDYLDGSNWKLLLKGSSWRNIWDTNIQYAPGDTIIYLGIYYVCNYYHLSSNQNYPGDNGSGFYYWDILIDTGAQVGMSERGDLLTYGLSRTLTGDGSTLGPTRVPIGNELEVLSINNESNVYYKEWGLHEKVRYVSSDDNIALDDVTDLERGKSPFRPWRTIRYACEQIEALGENAELITVKILPGIYHEVLPIIVPANVALRGDELRSVTVKPNYPSTGVTVDSSYHFAALLRLRDIMHDVLLAQPILSVSNGNNEPQVFPTDTIVTTQSFVPAEFDEDGNEVFQSTEETVVPVASDNSTIEAVRTLIDEIIDYIDFHLDDIGSSPTMTGSNDVVTSQFFLYGAILLEENKEFLAQEAVSYLQQFYQTYSFNTAAYKELIKKIIDAWKYDITYTGNYKSLMSARYYCNIIQGSELEDMFYVRNATGIRNMTLSGLNGISSPVNIAPENQRPTAGAYVSLDPGWGPDDERTWILTRSPYVQNVTTFGNGATGQKIDGALHNGGNKSIVSNDFTQVISDGIGAWVRNNGRAELVSVFTYYANIGMFAENGGVIRATNGNSSYGNIGALSLGNDPTETPTFGFINNRTQSAEVATAFAGEANDEILILEWAHAGQNYTTATFNIVGSGSGASAIFEETRDNAIFQAQIRNPIGVTNGSPGGTNYLVKGNNAQFGDATSITIASNDTSTVDELVGLRIILTSGPGTGQYGYVTAFDEVTKQVTVRRESDNEFGWDHVVPGYPYANLITTNTVYRFEPRVGFSDPGFTAENIDVNAGLSWANVVYGETQQSFNFVSGSEGTGETINITPFPAIFNIVKNARSYTVTLFDGGAGYEVDQNVIIDGEDVGGLSGENDIVITVTEISDDSTNAIVSFTHQGVAQSGLFIATATTGDVYVISQDGETWETANLPFAGNYRCLAWGENTFVAIANNTNRAYTSTNGITWTLRTLPVSRQWIDMTYGDGIFVAIAANQDSAVWSTNGVTWNSTTIPDFGDSSSNQWVSIAYGNGKFVVIANSANASALGIYDSGAGVINWTTQVVEVDDSTPKDWTSVAYGNGRFVAVSSTGDVTYTFDGILWVTTSNGMPSQDGSTQMNWKKVKYAQGVFFAICDTGSRTIGDDPTTGPTNYAATSYDGIVWTSRTLSKTTSWTNLAFGNPDISEGDSTTYSNSTGMWILLPAAIEEEFNRVFTGAKALGRAVIEGNSVVAVRLWEPGSGYLNTPTAVIYDPNATTLASINCRTADRVLAQPVWVNRGLTYRTSTTRVTIIGDGFADITPSGSFVYVEGLTELPGPGAQFRFRGEDNFYTAITETVYSTQGNTLTGYFRISPALSIDDDLQHNAEVEIRTRYSQVRITGHDFLDIGTGNFLETNYPEIYATGDFTSAPENEVIEKTGGRVFYTSTDQTGNFRTGELFAVEQATGIVTISADFFDLGGLTELALGGVRLGGSGAVVREFSTDPLFTADSNNIVPTQRAIKAYLANRLNIGGSDLLTASFIAGTVKIGPDEFDNTANLTNNFIVIADFSGPEAGLSGSWIAQVMFGHSFN